MTPADFLRAARVPAALKAPQDFGPWQLRRVEVADLAGTFWINGQRMAKADFMGGASSYTILHRWSEATMHLAHGEVVMEDSARELRKHLPIWMAARGRVLVTGLGLGCVVRGLLANPAVEHVDVVEIDRAILRIVGPEFHGDPRVALHHADAMNFPTEAGPWDFAWHDLWVDGDGLQSLHMAVMRRFWKACPRQGAWAFPRSASRRLPFHLLGLPRHRHHRPVNRFAWRDQEAA